MPEPRHLLARLETVSPCEADWNEMTGTDRVRFCSHCSLHVHDVSRMTRRDVEALVRASSGRLCMRIVRDPSGRARTADVLPTVPIVRRASRLAAGAMTVALAAGAAAPAVAGAPAAPPAVASSAQDDEPWTGGGTLVGTVVDSTGAVVAAAEVRIESDAHTFAATVLSDAEGAFRVEVPEGTYSVEVVSEGFQPFEASGIRVEPAQTVPLEAALGLPEREATVFAGGIGIRVSPAYDLVWHNGERTALRGRDEEEPPRPALADADDLEAALRETRDVDAPDVYGDTALMFVAAGSVEEVDLLLTAGANPNATDMYGATTLMRAALYDDAKVVEALLAAGADVNATDNARFTALMAAAYGGNADVVKVLLEAGADVRTIDARGETALSYARKEKAKPVIKLLKAAGAVR